nr:CHAT domain-containing protein [Gammaproteobacteria bacterium]
LVQRSILTSEHPAIAVTLHHLASVYFAKGLYRDSRHYLKESLSISSKEFEYFYPTYADSLDLSSVINTILGHYKQAVDDSRLATESTVQRLQSSAGQHVMRGAFSEHLTNRHRFEHHLENLVALKLSRNTLDSKSYYEELFKILQFAHISTTSHALFAHQKRKALTPDNEHLKPLTLQQTQLLLNRDEALLLYFMGWDNSYVMMVQRNRARFVQLDLDRKRLSAILQPVLDSLHNPGASHIGDIKAFDLNNAHQLYLKLLAPLSDDLQSTQQLLLVRDPFLTALRFPLLISKPAKQIAHSGEFETYRTVDWLIKRFSSAELPSVSALSILRAKRNHLPGPAKLFAAFGEPVLTPRARYNISQSTPQNAQSAVFGMETTKPHYNLSQSSPQSQQLAVTRKSKSLSAVYRRFLQRLPTLIESGDELRQLAGLLKVGLNSVMLKQQATETNIKRHDLSDYQILAFATHGLSPQQTALLNGNAEAALLLSVPLRTTAFDDGLLTASEIAQLRLNADLVILSTCNNGVNDVTSLNGLERAFFLAGSRSLLISYWNLESQAARLLTTKTFEILTRQPQLSRAQALQKSVLSLMLDNKDTHYAHPYFWAVLGIVGESGQLNMPRYGH